jgi:hypothetical protein
VRWGCIPKISIEVQKEKSDFVEDGRTMVAVLVSGQLGMQMTCRELVHSLYILSQVNHIGLQTSTTVTEDLHRAIENPFPLNEEPQLLMRAKSWKVRTKFSGEIWFVSIAIYYDTSMHVDIPI